MGAYDAGGSAEAVDGALEVALLGFGGGLRHEGLGAGPGERHEVEERDREPEEHAGFGEAEAGVADGSAEEAEEDAEALTIFLGQWPYDEAAVDDGEDADDAERDAGGADAPVVAVVGVEDVDVHERLLGEVAADKDSGEQHERLRTGEHGEGADGVGTFPGERIAVFLGEGLGQDEGSVEAVEQREAGGDEEGQARVDAAKNSAHGGAEDEADTEGRGEHTEGCGAFFVWSDVGHVGHCGGDGGGGEPRDDSADEEPGEGRGPGHHEVVGAEAEVGEQDDGAAAEAI